MADFSEFGLGPERVPNARGPIIAARFIELLTGKFALGVVEARHLYQETVSLEPKPLTRNSKLPLRPTVTRPILGEELAAAAMWGDMGGHNFAYSNMWGRYEYAVLPARSGGTLVHVRHILNVGATGPARVPAGSIQTGTFTALHPRQAERVCDWVESMEPKA